MMTDQRGSTLLNVLLLLVVIAAVVLVVIPKIFAPDPGQQDAAAKQQLSAAYQVWRIKTSAMPALFRRSASQTAAILDRVKQVQPVGALRMGAAPGVSGKVFLTSKTGHKQQFQAVIKSVSGKLCVVTAQGYSPPTMTGC